LSVLPESVAADQLTASHHGDVLPDGHFEVGINPEILGALKGIKHLSLAVACTSMNQWSMGSRIDKGTRIGTDTWLEFRAAHPDAKRNIAPRIRVVSIYSKTIGTLAWDLDLLSASDQRELLNTILRDKLLIVHDAIPTLTWLFASTHARPTRVIDTMLLLGQVHPEWRWRPYNHVEEKNTEAIQERLLQTNEGQPEISLDWDAYSCGVRHTSSFSENFAAWAVTPMTALHFRHCCDVASLPSKMLKRIFPELTMKQVLERLETVPAYRSYESASIRMAEASIKGMGFNCRAADHRISKIEERVACLAEEMSSIECFSACRHTLADVSRGETTSVKEALARYLDLAGFTVSEDKRGHPRTSAAAFTEAGCFGDPVVHNFYDLAQAKRRHGVLSTLRDAAKTDGKIHSTFSFATATGRLTSISPSLHNLPTDNEVRSCFEPSEGMVFADGDFKALEMRCVAASAEREIGSLREMCVRDPLHLLSLIATNAANQTSPIHYPAPTLDSGDEDLLLLLPPVLQRILSEPSQVLSTIFSEKIDPHDLTALALLRMRGELTYRDSPLVFFRSLTKEQRAEIKPLLKVTRKMAKHLNFGLLYGMGKRRLYESGINEKGLKWTFREAVEARETWFRTYPEVRLVHLLARWRADTWDMSNACTEVKYHQRFTNRPWLRMRSSTMTGRPVRLTGTLNQGLNHPIQGTAADMLARTICILPQHIADMMVLTIHDELLFEVPARDSGAVIRIVKGLMKEVGEEVLEHRVPMEASVNVDEQWLKEQ
jgi:hypothetical protein